MQVPLQTTQAIQCMTKGNRGLPYQAHEHQDRIGSTAQLYMLPVPCSHSTTDAMEAPSYLVASGGAGGGALAGQSHSRHWALLRAQRRALEVRRAPALRQQPPAAHVHA